MPAYPGQSYAIAMDQGAEIPQIQAEYDLMEWSNTHER